MKSSIVGLVIYGLMILASAITLIWLAPGWVLALLVFLFVVKLPFRIPPLEPQGALAGLTVGRPIELKDRGAVYDLHVLDEDASARREIVEIGVDYLVVSNINGSETRIPAASIKAVIWEHPERETETERS